MKRLTLERESERDRNGYATWVKTVENSKSPIKMTISRIIMGDISRVVNNYTDNGFDITIYDEEC